MRSRIGDALDRLRPDQAQEVRLHHMDGLPLAEVARRMGRSEKAVKKLCARGRKRMRGMLGAKENWF